MDHTEPRIETYQRATATPFRLIDQPRSVGGCLYDERGRLIRLSQRIGGHGGDYYPSNDPETIEIDTNAPIPVLKGDSIYLGHYMSHYGHFILETLSTFWIYEALPNYDNILFHPFVFGTRLTPFVEEAFSAMAIPSEKIRFLDQTFRLERVTIPERLLALNSSANIRLRRVYQELIRKISAQPMSLESRKAIYFSRSNISLQKGNRAILNEPIIEGIMSEIGFEVMYPECLTLAQQISLVNNAEILAGLSGSALHNAVFMRPKAVLIEIGDVRAGDRTPKIQNICNELGEITHFFIPFDGWRFDNLNLTGILRLSKIRARLQTIVAELAIGRTNIGDNFPARHRSMRRPKTQRPPRKSRFRLSWIRSYGLTFIIVVKFFLRTAKKYVVETRSRKN